MSPFKFRKWDTINKLRSDVWAFEDRKSGQASRTDETPEDRLRGIFADAIARRKLL
jgi:hypothetical protein